MRNNLTLTATSAFFFSLMVLLSPVLQAQNCVGLSLHPNQDEILVTGLWSPENPETTYTGYFQLKSNQDTTYEFVVTSLRDELNNATIAPENVSLSAEDSKLMEDRVTEFAVTVNGIAAPGRYVGNIQILQKGGQENDCYLEKELVLEVYQPAMASIEETDLSQVVKTVKRSPLEYLLPRKIRQEEVSFVVRNTGSTPITFDEYSFILKGDGTKITLTDDDIVWLDQGATIAPRSQMVMRFSIPDTTRKKLEADEYRGAILLNPSHVPESLSVGLTLYSRTGVLGAIFALLIGILVGRMIKSVNNNQAQMEAMSQFIPIRDSLRTIEEAEAKKVLQEEADAIEAKINEMKGNEGLPELEQNMKLLTWKITEMNELEDEYRKQSERFVTHTIQPAKQKPVLDALNTTKAAILAGDTEGVNDGYAQIDDASKKLLGQRSRSLSGAPEEQEKVQAEIMEIDSRTRKPKDFSIESSSQEKNPLQKFWDWFFRIFTLISGASVSARVRYGFFRPLVALITFLVVLLLGFQEIYLNGGDTFGADGIYDHLKLFAWGLVSDIFSRTLTDEQSISSLKGISPVA